MDHAAEKWCSGDPARRSEAVTKPFVHKGLQHHLGGFHLVLCGSCSVLIGRHPHRERACRGTDKEFLGLEDSLASARALHVSYWQ